MSVTIANAKPRWRLLERDKGTSHVLAGVALSQENPHAGRSQAALASGVEVPIEQTLPMVEGYPLTAVVVTQCSQLVTVYLTMADRRLIRFDGTSGLPVDELIAMAYTATRSERVDVGCESTGVVMGCPSVRSRPLSLERGSRGTEARRHCLTASCSVHPQRVRRAPHAIPVAWAAC